MRMKTPKSYSTTNTTNPTNMNFLLNAGNTISMKSSTKMRIGPSSSVQPSEMTLWKTKHSTLPHQGLDLGKRQYVEEIEDKSNKTGKASASTAGLTKKTAMEAKNTRGSSNQQKTDKWRMTLCSTCPVDGTSLITCLTRKYSRSQPCIRHHLIICIQRTTKLALLATML